VLLCIADTLRVGGDVESTRARASAEEALKIFADLGWTYNLARSYHYVALTAEAQGDLAEAATLWEQAATRAGALGNTGLHAVSLMNLGVAHEALGNRERAIAYYRESYKLNEGLSDQREAARSRMNAGAILIEHGTSAEQVQGRNDVDNALAVFRQIPDRNFEVICLRLMAAFHRNSGRDGDAERDLNQALNIASRHSLNDEVAATKVDLARLRIDRGEYDEARKLLAAVLAGTGAAQRGSTFARILLGKVQTRLGNFDAAHAEFSRARDDLEQRKDAGLMPLLYAAMGELAYEARRMADARTLFARAAALSTEVFADAASLEARAYVGLIDALDGNVADGTAKVLSSLKQAERMGRVSIEARCRLYLARIAIRGKRLAEALQTLEAIPEPADAALERELYAQVHYWRSVALASRGDQTGAEAARRRAMKLLDDVRVVIPEPDRSGFSARPDIHAVIG
jgi:tetratricopeptide (TPR) repeat protein